MLRALPVGVGAALELRIDRGVPAGPAHRAGRLIVVFPALLTFFAAAEGRALRAGVRAVFAGLWWAASALALADPFVEICDQRLPPAQVQVRTYFAEPKMSFALSAREIKPLSGTTLPGVSLGLTRVETGAQRRIGFDLLRSVGDGRLCARPQIGLTLQLRSADIYVARELIGNDCLIAAVWHHELRHFAIWQETLSAAANDLERMMQAHYDGVVLLGSEAEVRQQVEADLQGRWAQEIAALIARGDIDQQLLDGRDAQEAPAWCDGALLRLEAQLPPGSP